MITIIIPTVKGNEENLIKCLTNLYKNTNEEFNLIIVKNDFIGFAKAINRGLYLGFTGDEDIILLNDDVNVKPFWLESLKEKTNEYDIIGDKYTLLNYHVPFYIVYIKKEVIKSIKLLDDRFEVGEWEDVDYCIRAVESGFKIGAVDKDICNHTVHGTINKLPPEMQEKRILNKDKFKEKWKGTIWATL